MKHVGTVLGAAIAGMFVMSVWGEFATQYGIGGGWFAGFAIIGIMWFLNHFVNICNNDGAWVDMAVGIGVAGTAKDLFNTGDFSKAMELLGNTLPTLGIVILGGLVGGYFAYKLEQLNCECE